MVKKIVNNDNPPTQPAIRFKGFTEEWKRIKLSSFTKITMGSSPKSENYNDEQIGLPLIQGNADLDNFKSSPRVYTTEITKECFPNEVLLSVRAPVGTVAMSHHHACIGRGIAALKPKQKSNLQFIFQWLLRNENAWTRYSQGSTFVAINSSDIHNMLVNVPALEEQTKIGALFQKIDQAIELQSKQLASQRRYKAAMLQKLFPQKDKTTPELRFKGFTEEWKKVKLGKVAYITTGKSNRQDSTEEGKYTFFDRSTDIRRSSQYLFDKEAIIIGGEGSAFPPKYFTGKFDLHQRAYAIMDFQNELDGYYLFNILRLKNNYFLSQAVGTTVKSLRLPMFQKMPIFLPSREEQEKIGAFFQHLDHLLETSESRLTTYQNLKKALLQRMFI